MCLNLRFVCELFLYLSEIFVTKRYKSLECGCVFFLVNVFNNNQNRILHKKSNRNIYLDTTHAVLFCKLKQSVFAENRTQLKHRIIQLHLRSIKLHLKRSTTEDTKK